KRRAHDADLKEMVVIRSPSPQLVPFKLHRFGQQRHPLDVSICLHKHPLIGFHTVPFKIVVADCSVWVHSWPFWLCCSGDCEQLLSAVLAIFELVQGFLSAEDVSCLNLKYT
ncbi:hypothetical protein, partial [Aeromonas caviae]|uniref:hypothetical protein n=1 Tax=Aeromonas caviae TaxID=648 RepID=UPI0030147FB2